MPHASRDRGARRKVTKGRRLNFDLPARCLGARGTAIGMTSQEIDQFHVLSEAA